MIILDDQETQQSSTSSSGLPPPPVIKNSAKTDDTISVSPSPAINTTSSPPPPPYIQPGPLSPSSPSYPHFNPNTAAHHHHHSRPHHPYHPHSHHGYHTHSHHGYHHTHHHHHSQPPTPTSPTTVPHTPSTAVEDHPLIAHYRIQQRDLEKRTLKRFFAAFLIALVIVTLSSTFVQLIATAALRSGRRRVYTTAVQGEEVSAVSADASLRTSVESASTLIPKERILSIAYPPPH